MKYVIINGSPRRKNTWNVVKQVKTNLDGEFEEIHLAKEKIPLCNGCHNCVMESEEKCPHADIIQPIAEKIRASDAMIIATPVYAMNVTALLKNFIDHTAYLYHRSEFFDKKALVVVTTAGAGHKKVANYLDETIRHWGVNKVYQIKMACGGKDSLETSKIDKTAKEFRKDVESKKLHSPKLMDIIYYNVWRAMASGESPIPADEKYWKETGLINYEFAPVVKLNPLKRIFGKMLYFILKRVLK